MVGRLVEQEHVGLSEQQFGQRESHLPAARELVGEPLEVGLLEAQTEEDRARVRLDGVAAKRLEPVVQPPVLLERALLVVARLGGLEVLRQHLQAMLERRHVLGGGERLFEDGATRHLDGFLLQVADDGVAGGGDRALVGVLSSGDDVEQRRLPRAVRAHERDPVTGTHAQTRVLEQDARTE